MPEIRWSSEAAGHMWDSHHVTTGEANEAVTDIDAVWFEPDPASKSGLTSRVVGWSHARREVLSVIVLPIDGDYEGVNGWPANATYRRIYREGGGMSDRDKLVLSEIEQSELTRNEPLPDGAVGVRKNQGAAVVLSVRIPVEMREQIEALAERLDVPATSLVRGFIADGLANDGQLTAQALVRKLETDTEMLRRLLG